jgi:hypothetical protein
LQFLFWCSLFLYASRNRLARHRCAQYNSAAEATFKGTVQEVRDRICPVSGGLGSHFILKLGAGKTIEVHLAKMKFVKMYDLTCEPGDELEVIGLKVKLAGVDTIFHPRNKAWRRHILFFLASWARLSVRQ